MKHLVAKLVGLVHHYQNTLAALELPYGLTHHIGHRSAARLHSEALQQLAEKLLAVPVFRTTEGYHAAVLPGIGLYRLAFATTGVTDYGHHEGVLLRVGQHLCHAGVALGLHHHPSARIITCLIGYRAPHIVGYKFPFSVEHLAHSRRTYATQGFRGSVLAFLALHIRPQFGGDGFFFCMFHIWFNVGLV